MLRTVVERFPLLLQLRDRDLAAHDNDVALGVGLAGDAACFVLGQAGIEDRRRKWYRKLYPGDLHQRIRTQK